MSNRNRLRGLAVLALFAAAAALPHARAAHPAAAAEPLTQQEVARMQGEVRQLIDQLEEISEMHDAAQRRPLVARHWQAVQAYVHRAQSYLPSPAQGELAPAAFGSAGACGLPQTLDADAYASRMREVLWTIRERLADAYAAPSPEARSRLLEAQVRGAYQGLALVRGFNWTGGAATPAAQAPSAPVADSASMPAYLVQHYCGQCHAAPPAELHSANEWSAVASRMAQHMQLAAVNNPLAIEQPSKHDLAVVVTYLEANACEIDPDSGV